MADEVTIREITDRIQVDIDDLPRFDKHAALPPAEPLQAVIRNTITGHCRTLCVHGFTAGGQALVLEGTRLVPLSPTRRNDEKVMGLEPRGPMPDRPEAPFVKAPDGMFAVFDDGRRTSVAYYDAQGRPVVIDDLSDFRELRLPDQDDTFVRIEDDLSRQQT